MLKIAQIIFEIIKILVKPFMGIKYCKSSCCECECMKNTNIEELTMDNNEDTKEK